MQISQKIAAELNVKIHQVEAAINLLDEGATVPFISRYRKEVTGGLSDTELRNLEERLQYLRELEARRKTILASIAEQDKLTPELEKSILAADDKATLEDIYLPYKPKRRTKAQIAKEAGLEPLALQLLQNPTLVPDVLALDFLNAEMNINTATEALEGARQILLELFSENADLMGEFRHYIWENGTLKTEVIKGKETEGSKFSDYFDYQEAIKKIPSHRALAFFRGQQEGILRVDLTLDENQENHCKQSIAHKFEISQHNRAADAWLNETVAWAWRIKFALKLELELLTKLREQAEEEAIKVFANNLKHLLMSAPAGSHVTLGLDPGFRTGVKAVVIDGTGKLLHYVTIFPHQPRNDIDGSLHTLLKICKEYNVKIVSIGNGTASRETDRLIIELKKKNPDLQLTSIVVSEAGASVYSASEYAALEFPTLDVTYRGAVSIARRLQDPLAELVKIEPKAIGVGQYQHDVNQYKLSRTLRAVMEDCVNAVGVDINTASAPLLTCVAGLNDTVAKNIINYRDENGPFKIRNQLKKVARLGEKAFEQAAGFLRIINGDNPLDASAVHPEAYSIVEKILSTQNKQIAEVMGNTALLRNIKAKDFVDDHFGLPTVTDILHELEKPGRDPRPEFKTATFKEGVETMNDLTVGMVLEGVVTNVANFGAFVDIGVHQDGLVHKSLLANQFVKDPHEVIKVGEIVKVKVLEIDLVRKRIQLSMRLNETAAPVPQRNSAAPVKKINMQSKNEIGETALGNAFMNALKKIQ
ncbi:MAG: Tex family protein [Gammaproteobacteria bacterium]|nr:Tex family protein [Gammaproteobacteria bacterium]